MKHQLLSLIFFAYSLVGILAVQAETPVSSGADCNATSVPYTGISTPFLIQPQAAIPVNEQEVRAGLLYDAVNGKIVWQKNMSNTYPIASLTKMMVAFLAVEDVRAGLFTWQDNVKWTRETIAGRGKKRRRIYTPVNYSLRDVFKAAMIASNNECAEQLARYIGCGNLQETIDRMNRRAKELGMMNTYYGNPTGLPAAHSMFDNSSTPSDLLVLTMEMLKYNEVIEIASMGYANIENGRASSVISNHNRLTIDYSGEVDGLKTGYTRRAGFCLVATTAKCDHRLVSIVLGCRGPQIRNEVVRDMINDYYSSISLDRLGPSCPSPLNPDQSQYAQTVSPNGKYITINETVKKVHRVKRGESLGSLAKKYKCTTAQIRSWNKKSVRRNTLVSGQNVLVYVKQPKSIFIQNPVNGNEAEDDKPLMTAAEKEEVNKELAVDATPTIEKVAVKQPTKYLYHTVAPGDTLFNIAKRYEGITVEELKSLNNIGNSRNLRPGTKLKVKVRA
jgi:D-alanyl-D-alanine carboxypeptidase